MLMKTQNVFINIEGSFGIFLTLPAQMVALFMIGQARPNDKIQFERQAN